MNDLRDELAAAFDRIEPRDRTPYRVADALLAGPLRFNYAEDAAILADLRDLFSEAIANSSLDPAVFEDPDADETVSYRRFLDLLVNQRDTARDVAFRAAFCVEEGSGIEKDPDRSGVRRRVVGPWQSV